jgi:hypothetical protein
MKLRLVQDHDAELQPWFRVEQYLAATDTWYCVHSGSDQAKMRERLESMAKAKSTRPEITVLDEREV